MENGIKDRINRIIQQNRITKAEFEKKCGMSNGYVNAIRNSVGALKLEQILKAFPDLNREWLLYGEGEMLKSQPHVINSNNTNSSINESSTISKLIEMIEAKDKQLAEKDKQIESLLKLLTK